MTLSVRAAEAGEAPVLARLHWETALVAYRDIFPSDAPKPMYEELLMRWEVWLGAGTANSALVAVEDGDRLGVVLVGPDPEAVSTGHISRFYVRADRWGEGIGRDLHDAALDRLVKLSFHTASLWVLEHNQRTRAWYERLGWRTTGERKPVYPPGGIDDVRYVRDL